MITLKTLLRHNWRQVIVLTVLILLGAVVLVLAQGQGGVVNPAPVQPQGQTVSSLPAAASANQGQIRVVTDSTSISAEGQTCSGGSSNVALAFSTGSGWKCF